MKCKYPDHDYYPFYGLAPHRHDMARTGSVIGSTEVQPSNEWPKNFYEDPEAPGCGIYSCPDCGGRGHGDDEGA